jgi:hypothetical protein
MEYWKNSATSLDEPFSLSLCTFAFSFASDMAKDFLMTCEIRDRRSRFEG